MRNLPQTLGELRANPQFSEERVSLRRVKDELRDNLMIRLRNEGPIFPGIVGYDDTVVPQVVNAILSRHNFILAGAARTGEEPHLARPDHAARSAGSLLAGCEIHDNPYATAVLPLQATGSGGSREARSRISRPTTATWKSLATPDVTIADLIGDIDPIKAAKGGHELGSEFTVHYGLLPRANRGYSRSTSCPIWPARSRSACST